MLGLPVPQNAAKMKRLGILILLILAGIAAAGIYFFNKPLTDLISEDADVRISAEKLFEEFNTDEETANSKYLDKIVEVEGEVREVINANGETMLVLKSKDDLFGVSCKLSSHEKNTPVKNQKVKIKGICAGLLSDVILTRCHIVN